jgi:hypothetical protein
MKKVVIYRGKCIADHIMLRNAIVAIATIFLNKISMLELKTAILQGTRLCILLCTITMLPRYEESAVWAMALRPGHGVVPHGASTTNHQQRLAGKGVSTSPMCRTSLAAPSFV